MKHLKRLCMSAVCMAAMAAGIPEAKAQQGTIPAEGKHFSSSNWYVSALAGEQILLKGSTTGKYFVGKINAGTWFDTWSGIKVNGQAGMKKLNGNSSVRYYSFGVDYTLNLLRVFGGYDESTPFSFSVSAGPAMNFIRYRHGDQKYTKTVSLNIGAQIGYDFSPRWGLFAEVMLYTMDRFYTPGGGILIGTDAAVGIRFRFSRHKYGRRDADRREYETAISGLTERVAELEETVRMLNEKNEGAGDGKTMVTPETEAESIDIYFDEYSAFLNEEQRKKISGIGKWMADNPDFSVRIVVFSDNLSDIETGMRIVERREQVLRDFLTERYGIGSDRIESGSSEKFGYRNLTGCNARIVFINE